MTKIYKTLNFSKMSKKEKIQDKDLVDAINEMDEGLIDAKLGADLYKKRVATHSKGKRGGSRVIVALKQGDRAFVMYMFSKSDQDNINNEELKVFKKLAKIYLGFNDRQIKEAIKIKQLFEVKP